MKIWYQSFVNADAAPGYWDRLSGFLEAQARPGTELAFHGIDPFDSYAHALVEYRCGREAIANAITASREGYDGYLMGHFQDSGMYEARAAASVLLGAIVVVRQRVPADGAIKEYYAAHTQR